MRRTFALLLFALTACGSSPELDVETLAAPGPYAVGYRTFDIEYAPAFGPSSRRSFVGVWYPAQATQGERPFYTLRTSQVAVQDAPPASLGPRPVIVFSHGHQAYAAVMSHLMEHLASHGYIAIAPTHTGNTLSDGTTRTTDIYYLRTFDVSAALDRISVEPTVGALSDRRAIVGHSFGGYTAYALAGATYDMETLEPACAAGTGPSSFCSTMTSSAAALFRAGLADPRFTAVVSVDPGDFALFGATGVANIDLPVLHMAAEQSLPSTAPADDAYWAALAGTAHRRLLLLGGDHNDFTDSCASGFDLRCSNLRPTSVWRGVDVYTLAFLQKHLGGDNSVDPLLDGEIEVSALFHLDAR